MSKENKYLKRVKIISDKNNKSFIITIIDIIISYIFYGVTLTDYENYEFCKKSMKERKKYAVVRTQNKFYERVSPSKYKEFFTIKPNFLKNFKKYIGRSYYIPEFGIDKLNEFLNNNKEFIIKPIDGLGGADVRKESSKNIKNIKDFMKKLEDENLFLEELIIQHKKMSTLCKESVNTLRIMTFVNNGKSEILYAVLRVGNGTCEVDNFHKGGMGIEINTRTGKLRGNGIDKDLNEYKKHPVTNIYFDKFQLPFWDETKRLVLNAALVNENIKVVGWDVAITKTGPILVEGNRRPGFDIVQVVSKRGRKDIMYHVENKLNER